MMTQERKTTAAGTGRTMRATFLTVLFSLLAAPLGGQIAVSQRGSCPDPDAGTLGITGLKCEHCSFTRDRSGMTSAEFLTEPEIFGVDAEVTGGDELKVGDVLVALDGLLITSPEGADRFVSLQDGEWVELRIRRDGRSRTLRLRTGSACDVGGEPAQLPSFPDTPSAAAPPADPLPPPEPARDGGVVVGAPSPPPAPGAIEPDVRLGFSFECSRCGYAQSGSGEGAAGWFFEEPPVLYRVDEGSSAWEAGLRAGDELLAIDGAELTSEAGARRFTGLRAGRAVTWTVRRDARTLVVQTVPGPGRAAEAPLTDAPDRVRYVGTMGPAEIEVRGAPVTVSAFRERGLLVIRSSDLLVRIRVPRDPGGDAADGS